MFKEFIFVEIFRIKLLSEPSLRGVVDTKGEPLSTSLRILRKKKCPKSNIDLLFLKYSVRINRYF